MTIREQLYYLLEHYYTGDYRTRDFADQFSLIFRDSDDAEPALTEQEEDLFHDLDIITGRYSPYKQDHIDYPGMYYNDEDVRQKATEVYLTLKKDGQTP